MTTPKRDDSFLAMMGTTAKAIFFLAYWLILSSNNANAVGRTYKSVYRTRRGTGIDGGHFPSEWLCPCKTAPPATLSTFPITETLSIVRNYASKECTAGGTFCQPCSSIHKVLLGVGTRTAHPHTDIAGQDCKPIPGSQPGVRACALGNLDLVLPGQHTWPNRSDVLKDHKEWTMELV